MKREQPATAVPGARDEAWRRLLVDVRACRLCEAALPFEPKPILQFDPRARILVAGQAPGRRAHASGVPFSDASGERLRSWMGLDAHAFHDPALVAILPMGMCFPGSGETGDAPPRPECAPAWRARLLAALPRISLTLVIGRYAIEHHLPGARAGNVTDVVRSWRAHWPSLLPLPHPSPRNNRWLAKNPWFESEVLPGLRARIAEIRK